MHTFLYFEKFFFKLFCLFTPLPFWLPMLFCLNCRQIIWYFLMELGLWVPVTLVPYSLKWYKIEVLTRNVVVIRGNESNQRGLTPSTSQHNRRTYKSDQNWVWIAGEKGTQSRPVETCGAGGPGNTAPAHSFGAVWPDILEEFSQRPNHTVVAHLARN